MNFLVFIHSKIRRNAYFVLGGTVGKEITIIHRFLKYVRHLIIKIRNFACGLFCDLSTHFHMLVVAYLGRDLERNSERSDSLMVTTLIGAGMERNFLL